VFNQKVKNETFINFLFQCCGLRVRIQHFISMRVRIQNQPSKINVDLSGPRSTLIYLVFTMESYLNPVCGVQTEIAEPHGEPPTRGMDHSVHTLLIIKIILQTKNIYVLVKKFLLLINCPKELSLSIRDN
jgi:hypothetical protein